MMNEVIIVLFIICLLVASIHLLHALFVDSQVKYNFMDYQSDKLFRKLDGYQLVFISDIHRYSPKKLKKDVEYLNELEIDLLLLGGDFPTNDNLEEVISLLASVKAKDGVYAVDGNHDNYQKLFSLLNKHGIRTLDNSGVSVRDNFYLAGVEDLWNRKPDIAEAITAAKPDDFIVLISHNPDIIMQQNTSRINLTLAGHTHGGEVTFFGILKPSLWGPWITRYGQRLGSGWTKSADNTDVYVSSGLGTQRFRIYAQGEYAIIRLKSESK